MFHQQFVSALRPLSAAVMAACALGVSSAAMASEPAIGQVSLLIGVARVVHMDGSSEPLRRGASIVVGDRVETSANGHVHLRFIDNGAVSVRPDSVLEVQAYRYDADKPQTNEVRLRVEQGTSRSISGAATELDKNRFRLNTPIAAIGVRGTDFIVQSDAQGVRATVADGAIVVGALGGSCTAAGLGPCLGSESRLLTAGMGSLMAEVRHGERVARVVPASGSSSELAGGGAEERAAALYAAESAARTAAQVAADSKVFALMRDADKVAAEMLVVPTATTASIASLNTRSDQSAQLMWGHWITAPALEGISWPKSSTDGREQTTVYDTKGAVSLYRAKDPSYTDGLLHNNTDGVVKFGLTHASATYESGGRSESAAVDGRLVLDFSRRTFVTALGLSAAGSGVTTTLNMGGDIEADGRFKLQDKTGSQKIDGAVSFDSKEVGYLFERSVVGGLFRGKTLWGR